MARRLLQAHQAGAQQPKVRPCIQQLQPRRSRDGQAQQLLQRPAGRQGGRDCERPVQQRQRAQGAALLLRADQQPCCWLAVAC
jgi:hypothetical protein